MSGTTCFRDFCLACDREAPEGLYCSQSCRLQDLERAHASSIAQQYAAHGNPTPSQRLPIPSANRSRTSSSYDTATTAYMAYRDRDRSNGDSSQQRQQQSQQHRQAQQPPTQRRAPIHGDASTSSMASSPPGSIASASRSSSNSSSISDGAREELQQYYRSFDQTRKAKRRQSLW